MLPLRKSEDVSVEAVTPLDLLARLELLSLSATEMRQIKRIQQKINSPLYVKVPDSLLEFDTIDNSLLEAIKVADTLQRTGVIEKIIRTEVLPDEPKFYRFRRVSRQKSDGGGAHFFSESEALWACIAEAYERHLWRHSDFYTQKLFTKTYEEVEGSALNIFSLAGFLPEQKENFPILQFTKQTIFGWLPGYSLHSGRRILCPAQLISSKYAKEKVLDPYSKKGEEPMLRWPITTGLATAATQTEALAKSILEISERDAFMRTFLNKESPPLLNIEHIKSTDPRLRNIITRFEEVALEPFFVQLPNRLGTPTILALIIDRSGRGPFCTMGAAATFDINASTEKALSEALFVRYSIKHNYEYVENGRMGLAERIRFYAQEKNFSKIAFLIEGEKNKLHIDNTPLAATKSRDGASQLRELVSRLRDLSMEAVWVPLEDVELQSIPLKTVQVVIPEMQPLHPDEKIPYWGGQGIKKIFNKDPHPFP